MEQEKIIMLFHGYQTFKKDNYHDFDDFVALKKDEIKNKKIEKVYWYKNDDKKTLGIKNLEKTITQKIEEFKDDQITLVGYSAGSVVCLAFGSKYNNVKNIIAIYPTLFIDFKRWFKVLLFTLNWNTKAKLSNKFKNKYPKAKNKYEEWLNQNGVIEKHLFSLAISVYFARKKWRKWIKNLHNKNIILIVNKKDTVNNVEKSLAYFDKMVSKTDNKITFFYSDEPHGTALKKDKTKMLNLITNQIINL